MHLISTAHLWFDGWSITISYHILPFIQALAHGSFNNRLVTEDPLLNAICASTRVEGRHAAREIEGSSTLTPVLLLTFWGIQLLAASTAQSTVKTFEISNSVVALPIDGAAVDLPQHEGDAISPSEESAVLRIVTPHLSNLKCLCRGSAVSVCRIHVNYPTLTNKRDIPRNTYECCVHYLIYIYMYILNIRPQ